MTAYPAETSSADARFVDTRERRVTPPVGGRAKRAFDVVFSAVAILSALPFFAVLPIMIYVMSPGPVFFAHQRIGFRGRAFPCLKLRTMVPDAERILEDYLAANPAARAEFEEHRKLRRDPRIIPVVGNFLRRSSLDELPQFFNVLRGDMSVVGPRPLTLEELHDYGEAAGRYKAARPGITGLWQVSGRSDLSFRKRVELDSSYVMNCSLVNDITLIWRTIRVLLTGSGAY